MSVYWGAQSITSVAANGKATQLFPVGAAASGMTSTTAGYPPATSGKVRRPIHGRIARVQVTGDGTNAATVELWDVGGTDRGATYTASSGSNVNNDDYLTDAYLSANGTKMGVLNVAGAGGSVLTDSWEHIPFNKGLAIRSVGGAGGVTVSVFAEGGFMVQEVHS